MKDFRFAIGRVNFSIRAETKFEAIAIANKQLEIWQDGIDVPTPHNCRMEKIRWYPNPDDVLHLEDEVDVDK